MLDFNYLPKPQKGSIDYFWGKSFQDAESWEVWEKPIGANMIVISAIGGGAGGGGGASNASTAARGGGAGGGSGAFTQVVIPAIYVPDILYVSSGEGGQGGAAGNPAALGDYGSGSFVAVKPFEPVTITTTSATTTATATSTVDHGFTTGDSVVITGATPGQYNGTYTITVTSATTFTYTITATTPTASTAGAGDIKATKLNQITSLCYAAGGRAAPIQASSTATSAAPIAAAAAVIANMPLAGLGYFKALAGQAGVAGGLFNNGAGGSVTYPATGLLLSAGTGGGGGSSSSGAITGPTQPQERFIAATIALSAAGNPGVVGKGGVSILRAPFSSTGAVGGGAGSNNGAVAGAGQNGGFGSGGSGGGGGSTGGAGGDGGQGVVIIQSF